MADVGFTLNRLQVRHVSARRDRAFGSGAMSVRQVDFLVQSLLMGVRIPAPLPPNEPIEDTKIVAIYLFSTYGRHAVAGTYEEVKGLRTAPEA